MLNRRILRIKAFKVLYSSAVNPGLTLKDALKALDESLEATRDLYLYMLGLLPALAAEASRRLEAARGKFNPTEEDLHPNFKFSQNKLSSLLASDPDFVRLNEKKHFSWEQNDSLVHSLMETILTRDYFRKYMDSPLSTLQEDAALWKEVFTRELEDNPQLEPILEDLSIHWSDDLPYVLGTCIRSIETMGKTGRWSFPPLYQSDVLAAQGKQADPDDAFVRHLVSAVFGRREEYSSMISASVSKWDLDRLCTSDIVLVSMGLAEAETFPEIPLKVSINEYVEIAKYYSTPRSSAFVNGLLDRLIRTLEEEGRIIKNTNN